VLGYFLVVIATYLKNKRWLNAYKYTAE